jgi:hypothetical protein
MTGSNFSPEFRRLGPSALFSVTVRAAQGPPYATVLLQHRHEGDEWRNAGSLSLGGATGRQVCLVRDLRALLRYELRADPGAAVDLHLEPIQWLPSAPSAPSAPSDEGSPEGQEDPPSRPEGDGAKGCEEPPS